MSVAGKVLVVVPTYNERENIERAVSGIRACGYDALVVDDSSPDGTAEVARRLGETDPGVMLVQRPGKLGLGSAYVAGFRYGLERGYDFFVEMDADGSHRARDLNAIVDACRGSGGLAIGSRYMRGGEIVGWPFHRLLLSRAANVYTRTLLRLRVRDVTSGFRCYTGPLLTSIKLDTIVSQGYSFQIEMVHRTLRAGYPVVEVPIHFEDRIAGASKVSRGEIRRAMWTVLRLSVNR